MTDKNFPNLNFIDRSIAFFSPKAALRRHFYRARLQIIEDRQRLKESTNRWGSRSKYAAASQGRLIGDWSPVDGNVNDVIGSSAVEVRKRVRQLVRDFPYLARAVNTLTTYTVGTGIQFESKVKFPGAEEVDTKISQQIEDSINRWMDEADISGRLHFYEIQELTKRQDLECGEFILIKRYNKRNRTTGRSRYIPFALQVIEPDWLTSYGVQIRKGTVGLEQGVEYDNRTGEILAYNFADPDSYTGKTIRVKAQDVIHGFKTLRPGQLRGISPFTAGVLLANDIHNFLEAHIDTAKLAAKYLAFVESPDLDSRTLGLTDDAEGKKIDEVENAIIEYLTPGEKVTLANTQRPGDNFDPFTRFMLRMLSVTTDIPYEILSGDYSNMNYSTGRTSRNDFAQFLKPTAVRQVRHMCAPAVYQALDLAVLSGKLSLQNYFTNPRIYYASMWQPPGMESIDPLREIKARISEVDANLRSPQEIIRARGGNPEDVIDQIKSWKQMIEDAGISTEEEPSTALANNPSAVEEQNAKQSVELNFIEGGKKKKNIRKRWKLIKDKDGVTEGLEEIADHK